MDPNIPVQAPEAQPAVPPIPQPKSKLSKWFIALVVILILLIVGGISAYVLNKNLVSKTQTIQQVTIKSTPTVTPRLTGNNSLAFPRGTTGFQKLLADNCKTVEKDSILQEIDMSLLPIKIDSSVINLSVKRNPSIVSCEAWTPYKVFVSIPFQIYGYDFGGDIKLYLFDKQSEEPGHGGASWFQTSGIVIKDDGVSKYAVYFGFGEVPIVYPSSTPVIISAEKKIHLSNGEDVSVSFKTTLLHGDDPRLVNILSKYSVKRDDKSIEITDTISAEKEMAAIIFGDLNNLKSPEKEKLAQVENALSAISAK